MNEDLALIDRVDIEAEVERYAQGTGTGDPDSVAVYRSLITESGAVSRGTVELELHGGFASPASMHVRWDNAKSENR